MSPADGPLLPPAEGPSIDWPDWTAVLRMETLLPGLLQTALVLALAFFGYRLFTLLTRRLEREIREENPFVKRLREQRARTLASLLNSIALVVIVTLAALTILGAFIDIGPLLATAGVAGLAISFGAQSLVKDVISGAFILVEGQFGIGDVVRVGDASGQVEKITLRTTVLRDLEGVVHVIPNGEITRVSNLTKAWSRAVIDVAVAYREDIDRVLDVLRRLGRDFHADADWAPLLVEEPEVLGIHRFADSGIVVRMTVKTFPLKQWEVGRELRRRIKIRFDEQRIEIPFPNVTLHWGAGPTAPAAPPPDRAPADDRDNPDAGTSRRRLQS